MNTSRFTDSQIMAILKQAEAGMPAPELCREHGISIASFYKWRAKYGGRIPHRCGNPPINHRSQK